MNRRKVVPTLQSITLRLRFVPDSRSNSPLPTPRPSLAPLGDGREPHSDACAALACKHDCPYLLVCVRFALAHQLSFRRRPESIPDPDSAPPPVGLGRGAQPKMDQGERLSEPKASSSSTPFLASTAGCLERSGRTQTIGSPFFWVLFFGDAKKSASPAGARPGLQEDPTKRTLAKALTGSARTRTEDPKRTACSANCSSSP